MTWRPFRWRRRIGMCAAVTVAAALPACTFTTTNFTCDNGRCDVTLRGAGSETELYDDTVVVRLDTADGSTAQLAVNEQQVSCSEGETVQAAGVSVTCDSVGDDEVSLTVE